MSKTSKILSTIVVVFVFIILFGGIVGASNSKGGGVIGLIFFAALIGGLRAIWKSKKENGNDKDIVRRN